MHTVPKPLETKQQRREKKSFSPCKCRSLKSNGKNLLGKTVNGTRQILIWLFSPFSLSASVQGWDFSRNLPVGPSHTSPCSLCAKHHHSGLLRSLRPCNSHWRKNSGQGSLLQFTRKSVSGHSCSHSQSRERLPLLLTQMEKASKHRILRQLCSESRAIGSCFSRMHKTRGGLCLSGDFLYIWLLTEKMLQISPISSQQSRLSKGTAWWILCRKGLNPTGSTRVLPSGR